MAIYDEPLEFTVIFWGPMLNPPWKPTFDEYQGHWDALNRPIFKNQRCICPCEGENGQIEVFMAIYEEPLHFMVIFWGPMLIPPWKPILGEYPGHWDALIRQKCKNGSYFNPPNA